MTRYWAERAWLGRRAQRVLIEVAGERIEAVAEDVDPPADCERLPGLVLPGLANAHSHAFHRALRAAAEGGEGDFWSWRERMYEVAGRLDPESYHRLARAVYAEMALAGITAVGEFHYLHHASSGAPYANPNAMGEALIEASRDAGIRITLLDCCYLRGGFGRPLEGTQLRFGDGDAEGWARRVEGLHDGERVRIGAAVHSVRAVDDAAMTQVGMVARARGLPLHMHLLERREELSSRPLQRVAEAGLLGRLSTFVHATHVDDFAPLVETGSAVCICRTTERFLGDGSVAILPAELRLSFGSDSHAVVDLFEEARALELDERTRSGERGTYGPDRLLDAATSGGSDALGWDGGRLEPGALADFIALDLEGVRTTAPGAPEAAVAVFAASSADVTDVVVAGRRIVRDRRHELVGDVARELREAIAAL